VWSHYLACMQDMEIWDMVGLWHYPLPGLFLLAQFCLGILVALGNLVNNSVFLYLSDEGNGSSNDNSTVEGNETHCFNINWLIILFYLSWYRYVSFSSCLNYWPLPSLSLSLTCAHHYSRQDVVWGLFVYTWGKVVLFIMD